MEKQDKTTEEQENSDGLYEHYAFTIDKKQDPLRLDKFLLNRIEKISRTKIQRAIQLGAVVVNDKTVKSNYKIRPSDEISVLFPKPPGQFEIIPEDIPLDIVYEDDDLMVIHKPPGLVVHPGVGNRTGTLVNALAFYFKDRQLPVKEGNFLDRPGIVHRIDKDTSGLMLIAKTDVAVTHLSKQFFDHTVHRRYQAIVWGNFDEKEGTIDEYIGRDPNNRMVIKVFPDKDFGKKSVTHYKVIDDMYYVSLVECRLETGRTHQIRAHMKSLGHPLFNDERYGGDRIIKGTVFSKYKSFVLKNFKICPRQALHAKELGFIHPTTGENMMFVSELPKDMSDCLDRWRAYLNTRKELM